MTHHSNDIHVSAYYDGGSTLYWVQDNGHEWIPVDDTSYARLLISAGVSDSTTEGEPSSPLDAIITDTQLRRNVHHVGQIAGYKAGLHKFQNRRVLVPAGPTIIEPEFGKADALSAFLDGMFGDQIVYLLGWVKTAFEALREGHRCPGQVLVLYGPPGSGKRVLQRLITQILGGRMARPYRFMSGTTPYNSDILGSEHLSITGDEVSTDLGSRRAFEAGLKAIIANSEQQLHGVGVAPITVDPFWRLSIALNDDGRSIRIMPPLGGLEDKLMMLKTSPMSTPTGTQVESDTFMAKLISELPAFLDAVCNWDIPDELSSQRFGIKHFHDPVILAAMGAVLPYMQLLAMIELELFSDVVDTASKSALVELTAAQLIARLTAEGSSCRAEALRFFAGRPNSTCGNLLSQLARQYPERIVRRHAHRGAPVWVIRSPGAC